MNNIKKFLCILIALVFVCGFSACSEKNDGISEKIETTIEKSAYTISDNLLIRAEYLKVSNSGFGKHFFAFVKNCSEDTIIDYSVAYIGFDINGNVAHVANTVSDKIYGEEKITLANILPGDVYGLSDGSTEGIYIGDEDAVRYVKSAVSYIKFKSGEEWKIGDLDAWAQDTVKSFSVEEQKNYLQSLKTDAQKAMENPYLSISNVNISASQNSLIDALDMEFTVKNIGEKTVRAFSIIVLEFEDGNKGVKLPNQSWTWNYQYITNNSHQIDSELLLNPQEEITGVAESALVSYCTDYLIIVDHVEFEDDTVWNNDCALQFMMYNESEKLL